MQYIRCVYCRKMVCGKLQIIRKSTDSYFKFFNQRRGCPKPKRRESLTIDVVRHNGGAGTQGSERSSSKPRAYVQHRPKTACGVLSEQYVNFVRVPRRPSHVVARDPQIAALCNVLHQSVSTIAYANIDSAYAGIHFCPVKR